MIRTIIFDIGNVLTGFGWRDYLKTFHFSPEKEEAIANAMFLNPDWCELDRGVLTLPELLDRFALRAPEYRQEIERVFSTVGGCIQPYAYTTPWLQELKDQGFHLYYLSNYGEFMYQQTAPKLDFLSLMDGGILSWQEKMIKPNPWIYEALLKRYDIDRSTALFFDDTPANVEAARSVGLQAEVFTGHEAAVEFLKLHM